MLWNDFNPLFSFDREDQVLRRDFNKSLVGAGIFFFLLTGIDMRVLRRMKAAKHMGLGKKLVLINFLNAPFYYYFYQDVTHKYMTIEKHLVKKYLVIGDELVYKKKATI